MGRLTRADALDTFHRLRIDPARDFHALPSGEVEALIAEADRVRYRRPRNAPGSRARMFHAYLARAARRPA